MFSPQRRKRLRPGLKSIGLSLVVCPVALAMGWLVYQGGFYAPLLVALVVGVGLTYARMRGMGSSLPEPYGRGRITTIDSNAAARSGMMIVFGGILLMFGVVGSVFILPPFEYFAMVLGLSAGLPMSEILVFATITRLERKSRGQIISITEEAVQDGRDVLLKSIELNPYASD